MKKLPSFTNRAFLAPMAGVSDPALRLICKELGAGLVMTEFTNIHAIVARNQQLPRIIDFIPYSETERPLSVQLFGSEIDILAQAVKIVEPYFDIIDYNMGCPAPHITCQMAGAALLRDPELTRKLFRTMVQSTSKPVTLKLRAGLSKPDKFRIIAKIAEEEGVQMITLHARTLQQGYSGKADWNLIKELKQMVRIPVVGNGDIQTPEDAKRMLDETGCDYVMIGRAAGKNPFIFTQINEYLATDSYHEISFGERLKYFFRYLDYARKFLTIKFANIRMQAINFTKGEEGSKETRVRIGKVQDMEGLRDILVEMK